MHINRQLSGEIETRLEKVNTIIYNLRVDLEQAQKGLHYDIQFDLGEIRQIFEEARIAFPQQIHHGYESVLDFNPKMLSERKTHLQERVGELNVALEHAVAEYQALNHRRKELLSLLKDAPSLTASRLRGARRTRSSDGGGPYLT